MSMRFSTSDALSFAWARFKEQPGKLIGVLFISGLVFLVPYIISAVLVQQDMNLLGGLFFIVSIVTAIFVGMGVIAVGLKTADRQPWDMSELFAHTNRLLPYVGATILYGLITMAGMFLFVLPGIYWSVRFSQFPFFILDKQQGVVESLKSSWALTQGSFWDLFSSHVALMCLVYISMIPIGLGLFITIPMTYVFQAYIFRGMEKHPSVPVR